MDSEVNVNSIQLLSTDDVLQVIISSIHFNEEDTDMVTVSKIDYEELEELGFARTQ